mmetsp:Transcript_3995/g.12758  ORF Transcript_3995/g.12758 Transcript_3995/m.12758 type:complete len:382 (-) Transcript_3995:843-1988(-)
MRSHRGWRGCGLRAGGGRRLASLTHNSVLTLARQLATRGHAAAAADRALLIRLSFVSASRDRQLAMPSHEPVAPALVTMGLRSLASPLPVSLRARARLALLCGSLRSRSGRQLHRIAHCVSFRRAQGCKRGSRASNVSGGRGTTRSSHCHMPFPPRCDANSRHPPLQRRTPQTVQTAPEQVALPPPRNCALRVVHWRQPIRDVQHARPRPREEVLGRRSRRAAPQSVQSAQHWCAAGQHRRRTERQGCLEHDRCLWHGGCRQRSAGASWCRTAPAPWCTSARHGRHGPIFAAVDIVAAIATTGSFVATPAQVALSRHLLASQSRAATPSRRCASAGASARRRAEPIPRGALLRTGIQVHWDAVQRSRLGQRHAARIHRVGV